MNKLEKQELKKARPPPSPKNCRTNATPSHAPTPSNASLRLLFGGKAVINLMQQKPTSTSISL